VLENRVLKKFNDLRGTQIIIAWRKLHNEELDNLYFLPNIRMITSRGMRYAGQVAYMGERDHQEDLDIKGGQY
jgi:GH43 family beta-xylosidase